MHTSFAAPGPQNGIAHAELSAQPGIGDTPSLRPLHQNNLLTNHMYTMLPKVYVLRNIQRFVKYPLVAGLSLLLSDKYE